MTYEIKLSPFSLKECKSFIESKRVKLPDKMKSIIEFLGTKNAGYTRQKISQSTGISAGGTLSDDLEALGISGVNTSHSLWSKRSDDTDGTQLI